MKLVRQPPYSKVCGPACVATLLGVTLEYAVELVGTKGKTQWKHLRDALRKVGCQAPDAMTVIREGGADEVPQVCIARLWWGAKWQGSHWLVKNGDVILDPAFGEYAWSINPEMLNLLLDAKRVRITSFAEIKLPDFL